jgi:hypothetical protein
MRNLLTAVLVSFLTVCLSAAVTVTVSSPSSGATVNPSFTLKANASSPNIITGWYIYVDGNPVWDTPGPTSSISAPITVATGSHSISVRAWDSTGASGSANLSLTAAAAANSVTVLAPANGTSVSSPVTFSATGTSPNGISGWVIYADGQNVYQIDNNSNSLTASVNLSAGTHTVYIRAWDKHNGSYGTSSPFTINVTAANPTSTTVNIQTPSNGASVGNPVNFTASASSPHGISGWVIYMDNQNVYQVDNYSNTLNASANLPGGRHTIYIRAWDRVSGYGTSPSFTINVGGSGALPTPPSSAKVFSNIEDMSGFKWCSANCAGGQSTTNYWMAQYQGSPSMYGSSMQLFNGGNAWANTLWYKSLGQNNWASHFLWDFYVYFDSTTIANLHTAEFDFYQSIAGIELMVGSQCNFGEGVWDIWNQASNQWIGTSIPCKRFSANSWHHIQWYVERASWNQYRYVTLVVDGTPYSLNNRTYYGNYQGWTDLIGVQWQLDLGPEGVDAHEWVDKATLTIW